MNYKKTALIKAAEKTNFTIVLQCPELKSNRLEHVSTILPRVASMLFAQRQQANSLRGT